MLDRNPEKFMESEIELHVEVEKCLTIATQPQLYPVMVQSGGSPSLPP